MRVYASSAFRYAGIDYPFGWQDLPQTLADNFNALGLVAFNDNFVGVVGGVAGSSVSNKLTIGNLAATFATGTVGCAAVSPAGTATIANTVINGETGVKLTSPAMPDYATVNNPVYVNKLMTPVILTDDMEFVLRVYIKNPWSFGLNDFTVYLYNSATGFTHFLVSTTASNLQYGNPRSIQFDDNNEGYFLIRFNRASLPSKTGTLVETGAVVDAFRASFKMSNSQEVTLLDLRVNQVNKPTLAIYYDDGLLNTYQNAYPLMKRLGLKGTFAVMSSKIDTNANNATSAQLEEMYNEGGWDIVDHSYAHEYMNKDLGFDNNEICLSQSMPAVGAPFVLNGATGGAAFDEPRVLVFNSPVTALGRFVFRVQGTDEFDVVRDEYISTPAANQGPLGPHIAWKQITAITPKNIPATAITLTIGTSHSYNEIYDIFDKCQRKLLGLGFTRSAKYVVLPGGGTNCLVDRAMTALGVIAVRGTVGQPDPVGIINKYRLGSTLGGKIAPGTAATHIAVKNDYIKYNRTGSVFLHGVTDGITPPNDAFNDTILGDLEEYLTSVAASVKDGDLQCPTMSEYCQMIGIV